MGSLSPASTESSESGQHEELVGYPLQRMVPLESMRLSGEESPLLPGLYRMPASQSSSTSSHFFYVYVVLPPSNACPRPRPHSKCLSTSDFEAVVDEYLSHQNSDAQDRDMVRTLRHQQHQTTCTQTKNKIKHAGYRRSRRMRVLRADHSSDPAARKAAQHRARTPPRSQRRRDPRRPMEPSPAPSLHRGARRRRGPLYRASLRLRATATPDRRERSRLYPPVARGKRPTHHIEY